MDGGHGDRRRSLQSPDSAHVGIHRRFEYHSRLHGEGGRDHRPGRRWGVGDADSNADPDARADTRADSIAIATPAATPTPTPCAPAYAAFTYTQNKKNDPIVFTSISTPTTGACAINYWRWDFGDNSTSAGNLPTVSHDYGAQHRGETFTVALTVTVPGDPSITTTTYFNVTTKP